MGDKDIVVSTAENRELALNLMQRLEALNFSTNHFGNEGEWEVVGYSLHTPTAHRTGTVAVKLGALKALIELVEEFEDQLQDCNDQLDTAYED